MQANPGVRAAVVVPSPLEGKGGEVAQQTKLAEGGL
jgi:hypothetical protein